MAGQFIAFGKVLVPTPGTTVPLVFPGGMIDHNVHAVTISALPSNAGATYIGLTGMNKATFANVLQVLPAPTANSIPSFSTAIATAANGISLDQLVFDAANAGEGVLVSAIVA